MAVFEDFQQNCLVEMASHYTEGHMVAAMQIKLDDASECGIVRLGGLPKDNCLPVSGMIKKPTEGTAPSSFAAVGRYIPDPLILEVLEKIPTGKECEVQLTDAIMIAGRAVPVVALNRAGFAGGSNS